MHDFITQVAQRRFGKSNEVKNQIQNSAELRN